MSTETHGFEVIVSRLEEDDVKGLPSHHHIKKSHVGLWHASVWRSGVLATSEADCLATGTPNKSRRLAIRSAMRRYYAEYCYE